MKDDKLVAELGDRLNRALAIIAESVQQVTNRVGGKS